MRFTLLFCLIVFAFSYSESPLIQVQVHSQQKIFQLGNPCIFTVETSFLNKREKEGRKAVKAYSGISSCSKESNYGSYVFMNQSTYKYFCRGTSTTSKQVENNFRLFFMQKSSFYNCDSSYVPKLNYKEDIQILCKGPKTKY